MILKQTRCRTLAAFAVMCALATNGIAAEPEILVEGLDNPAGVAVQPGTGDVFVSANKAIHRLSKKQKYKDSVAVNGFSSDVYGKGPKYNIGPLGLLFLDPNTLVVGGGDQVDGEEVVRFYDVKKPVEQTMSDAKTVSGPIKPGKESAKGEGNFYALELVGKDIFVTCNGDDTKGWISKISTGSGKPGPLTPAIATKEAVQVDAPCGIAVNKDGKLVVSQMGEVNVPGDSLLTTYDPDTGKLLSSIKTGISDIVEIAYSPKTGKLYGVDFSWVDTSKGGLYELEVKGDELKATKIADIDKPTAIAFDEAGNAFVTAIGSPDSGGGKVLLFKGL